MRTSRRAPWIARDHERNNYYIFWFDEAAGRVKRRSCGTSDRRKAEEELGRFLIERACETKNTTPILTPDQYLIATALRWYAQEHGPEITNQEFLGRAIERLIKFFGPNAAVSHLTPQLTKRYARERVRTTRVYKTKDGKIVKVKSDKAISTATTRRELGVLSTALNYAVNNGRLTSAPKVELPPDAPAKTRYLEHNEIDALLNSCIEPHIKLFILLAINTGSRKGALLDLKWQQIDFSNRLIYLNPEGRTQTNKRRAIVPINDVLLQALNDQRTKLKNDLEKAAAEGEPIQPCQYVISYCDEPVKDIKHGFRMTCDRAKLNNVTPHTLRHTAGTLMALAGVDLFLIARLLGHTVQKTTELYAHLHPDYLRGAVKVLHNATAKTKLYDASGA